MDAVLWGAPDDAAPGQPRLSDTMRRQLVAVDEGRAVILPHPILVYVENPWQQMTVQIDGTAPVQVAAQDEWKGIAAGLLGGKRAALVRADKSLERRRDKVRVRPPGRAPSSRFP
jgi:hypothetical protein